MKKYKVKISCPDFRHMHYPVDDHGRIHSDYGLMYHPEDYPEIFEEVKEPLFITEDGIEIYDKNYKLHCVNKTTFIMDWILFKNGPNIDDWLFFSTIDASKEWIEQNKPKFSIKQLKDIVHRLYNDNKTYTNFITNFEKEFGI